MAGPKQDGQNSGPGELNLDITLHGDGPELLHDPMLGGSFQLSRESKNGKNP
jgi:hypothetical protein